MNTMKGGEKRRLQIWMKMIYLLTVDLTSIEISRDVVLITYWNVQIMSMKAAFEASELTFE